MGPEVIIDLFNSALHMVFVMVSIVIFQASTQINEQTLSFVPRLLITMMALSFLGPWLLKQLMSFTATLIENITSYIG
jgi:flagellar biosynthetic protein FliQ